VTKSFPLVKAVLPLTKGRPSAKQKRQPYLMAPDLVEVECTCDLMRKMDRYSMGTEGWVRSSVFVWIEDSYESRTWKRNLKVHELCGQVHHRKAPPLAARV
jgi:hypothetical protein